MKRIKKLSRKNQTKNYKMKNLQFQLKMKKN